MPKKFENCRSKRVFDWVKARVSNDYWFDVHTLWTDMIFTSQFHLTKQQIRNCLKVLVNKGLLTGKVVKGKKEYKIPDEATQVQQDSASVLKFKHQEIGIFINGDELWRQAARTGYKLDYIKLVDYLVGDGNLMVAKFYLKIPPGDMLKSNFVRFLIRNGFDVVSVEKEADMRLAIDVLLSKNIDTAILVGVNSDFEYLVSKSLPIRVEVASFLKEINDQKFQFLPSKFIDLTEDVLEFWKDTICVHPIDSLDKRTTCPVCGKKYVHVYCRECTRWSEENNGEYPHWRKDQIRCRRCRIDDECKTSVYQT